MKRKLEGLRVAILVADGFEEVEMTKPREALDFAGALTFLVSPNGAFVQGWHHDKPGDPFKIDVQLKDAKVDDYDALLLPGGVFNPDRLRINGLAVEFVRNFVLAQKPIAAICHGPWTLINAQGVKGKTMTSWLSLEADLTNAGAHWVDKEVVTDGNLVTSRMPEDIPAFNPAVIELFSQVFRK